MSDFEERAEKAMLADSTKYTQFPQPYSIAWFDGMRWGAADRERELLAPGPCKVHPKACWVEAREYNVILDGPPPVVVDQIKLPEQSFCTACRREQELRDQIAKLRKALEAAPEPPQGAWQRASTDTGNPIYDAVDPRVIEFAINIRHWHRTVRAAALGKE